ncbi:MAG TPA: nuclear transport factor 2 family protein [Candidatus Binatia bacterium]|nr:nuclear transport factor 2 family protein [Candidatus Binatia bacterium]
MKTILWLLLVMVWTLGIALAQNSSDAGSSRILALEREWNAAYKAGDVAKMNSLLANDFIITIEDGRTFSKSGYIALNGNATVHVDVSDMTDLKVRMHGTGIAVVTGAYHEKGASQNKPYEYHDRFTDVWMMVEGKWQIIVSQYSIPKSN